MLNIIKFKKDIYRLIQNILIFISMFWILLLSLSTTVYAIENGRCGDNVDWSFNGSTLTISGNGDMYNFDDDNLTPWYDFKDEIIKIIIKDGITCVGELAFYDCENLESVILANSITKIYARAFKEDYNLSSIKLSTNLETLGEAAFESCENLKAISLPNTLKRIDNYAFYGCKSLISVMIPSSVTYLGLVTFAYCTNLSLVTINCPLNKIPDWTFYGCSNLISLTLPDNTTEIGSDALYECDNLVTIYSSSENTDILQEQIDDIIVENNIEFVPTQYSDNVANNIVSTDDGSTIITSYENDSSNIVVNKEKEYIYSLNGEEVDKEVFINNYQENDPNANVDSRTVITIDAEIKDSDGWTDLRNTISNNKTNDDNTDIIVNIQIEDNVVKGEDLSKIATSDAELIITTSEGTMWDIDMSNKKSTDFKGDYDLSYEVSEVGDEIKQLIDSDDLMNITFKSDIDIDTSIAINIGSYNSGNVATIYENNGIELKMLDAVIIDDDGYAWFDMTSISKDSEYVVGVNDKSIDKSDARVNSVNNKDIVTTTDSNTLTDASGVTYTLGERSSKWGISSNQFMIYVAIGIGAIVLIVSGIMITINKINKNKMMYQAKADKEKKNKANSFTNDEIEEIKLKILRDMIEENKKQ